MTLSEKMLFLCLSVLQGSAETLFRCGGKINIFQLPKLYVIFMPKIIEIRKCSFKLQLKTSGVFLRHSVHKAIKVINNKHTVIIFHIWVYFM